MKPLTLLVAAVAASMLPGEAHTQSLGPVEWERPMPSADFMSRELDRDAEILKACLDFVYTGSPHGPFANVTWLARTDHGRLLVVNSVEWGFQEPFRHHSHVLLLDNTGQVIGRWEAPHPQSNLAVAGFFIALNALGSECAFLHAPFAWDGSYLK